MKLLRTLLLLVMLGTALGVPPARAQWAVFDSANYAQNVLEAARALRQIDNQIQELQNESLMLRRWAGTSPRSIPRSLA